MFNIYIPVKIHKIFKNTIMQLYALCSNNEYVKKKKYYNKFIINKLVVHI